MVAERNSGLEADIGISLGKLTRQLAAAEVRMIKAAKKYESSFANSNKTVSRSFDKAGKSAKDSAASIGKEMDRLRSKYDPVFAASKKYEASLEELNRAQKVGAITTQRYEAALQELNAEYARSNGATQTMKGGLAGLTRVTKGGAGGIQNVAFQVGDFATQVGAGTSASQALGQQLPQLLGGFGALGAVLGAVVAIGVPLAAHLINWGEESKTLSERLEELEEAVADYTSAVDAALVPTEELREKYGTATVAAQHFITALREIENVEALQSLDSALSSIAEQFGTFSTEGAFTSLKDGASILSEMEKTTQNVAEQFDLSVSAATALVTAMQAMSDAEGPRAQVSAAENLLGLLIDSLGPIQDMEGAALQFAKELQNAGIQAAEVQGNIDRSSISMSDIVEAISAAAGGMETLIGKADTLGVKLFTAAQGAWEAAGALGSQALAVGRGRGGDPRQFEDDPYYKQRFFPAPQRLRPPRESKKRSGGSSKSQPELFASAETEIVNLERRIEMIGKTKAEIASLTSRYKLLDEAKKRGLDLDAQQTASGLTLRQEIDAQANAVGKLVDKHDEMAERAKLATDANTTMKDGLLDAIVAGDSFAGTLENVAKMLARAALEAALFGTGPLSSLFGGSGGGGSSSGGGLANKIGSGLATAFGLQSFDGGGGTGRGPRSGGLDGKGGFMAMLHPNETVIDHMKGGGAAPSINQVFNINMDGGANMDPQQIVDALRPAMKQEAAKVYGRARREGR